LNHSAEFADVSKPNSARRLNACVRAFRKVEASRAISDARLAFERLWARSRRPS
jgi:hypothetical protein